MAERDAALLLGCTPLGIVILILLLILISTGL